MDVLSYSAYNQQIILNQLISDKTSCLSTKCSETAAQQAIAAGLSADAVCWVQCIEPCLLREPHQTSYWPCIPTLSGSGFKVCDTSGNFRCGSSCTWTVPSGITRARFQIWGAGGGSGPGCCCGGSPFGSTGAYASVIIPVTAGWSYTLCSGCAYCCYPSTGGQGRVPGCSSYVTGCGLSNFCANGGQGTLGTWMASYGHSQFSRISNIASPGAGGNLCNAGTDYCASSCASCGIIPYVPGASYFGTTCSSSPSIVYGIRGMWPLMCWDINHYGYQCHPPIYGFENTSQCNPSYSSGTCCGRNCAASSGYLQIPAAGGFYTHVMGGSNAICGDAGRMGMVCVTYC